MSKRTIIIAIILLLVILISLQLNVTNTDPGYGYSLTDQFYATGYPLFHTQIVASSTAKAYTDTPTPTPPHQDSF